MIVDGARTPFAKIATALAQTTALDLGVGLVETLLARAPSVRDEIGLVVFGAVIPSLSHHNIARDLALASSLRRDVEAFSVSRACTTSLLALTTAAESIAAGHHDVAIAGGADCTSDVPIGAGRALARALVDARLARGTLDKVAALARLSASDLRPVMPALAEPSTGLTMGESTEQMVRDFGIERAAQDAFAVRSHRRAGAAWRDGLFEREVAPVTLADGTRVARDNLVRADLEIDAIRSLAPVFDRKAGTLTAGNSSALSDGASAMLVMHEKKAESLGLAPLGFLRGYGFAALDPVDGLLLGPAYATPIALAHAGVTLDRIDRIEMHEAFAAQVLCNLAAFASERFAKERLGLDAPIGEVDTEKLNVHGGSLAIGHPFAATGGRLVISALHELRRIGGGLALVSLCAAGGLGGAAVLEVDRA